MDIGFYMYDGEVFVGSRGRRPRVSVVHDDLVLQRRLLLDLSVFSAAASSRLFSRREAVGPREVEEA